MHNYIKYTFKNYFMFKGRASRKEFWYFTLFFLVFGVLTGAVDLSFTVTVQDDDTGLPFDKTLFSNPLNIGSDLSSLLGFDTNIFANIFIISTIIPYIALAIRRFHDINKSGWWILINFTGIGMFFHLYFMARKGDETDNRFGPPSSLL